eukprot:SM000011S19184  [mRNA]  locus=s11:1286460:1286946:+ [translate_table: standard]
MPQRAPGQPSLPSIRRPAWGGVTGIAFIMPAGITTAAERASFATNGWRTLLPEAMTYQGICAVLSSYVVQYAAQDADNASTVVQLFSAAVLGAPADASTALRTIVLPRCWWASCWLLPWTCPHMRRPTPYCRAPEQTAAGVALGTVALLGAALATA